MEKLRDWVANLEIVDAEEVGLSEHGGGAAFRLHARSEADVQVLEMSMQEQEEVVASSV